MMDQYFRMDYKLELEKKLSNSFLVFFNKIPGYYFGLLTVFFGGISIILSYILFKSANNSYSIFTNYISDLGVGPNGANLIFGLGLPIMSFMSFFYHISELYRSKQLAIYKFLLVPVWLCIISNTIGGILAGIFNITYIIHSVAAFLYFMSVVLYYLMFLIITSVEKQVNKVQVILYAIVFSTSSSFLGISLITFIFPDLSNIISITFMEWTAVFSYLPAILIRSLYLLQMNNKKKEIEGYAQYLIILNNNYMHFNIEEVS